MGDSPKQLHARYLSRPNNSIAPLDDSQCNFHLAFNPDFLVPPLHRFPRRLPSGRQAYSLHPALLVLPPQGLPEPDPPLDLHRLPLRLKFPLPPRRIRPASLHGPARPVDRLHGQDRDVLHLHGVRAQSHCQVLCPARIQVSGPGPRPYHRLLPVRFRRVSGGRDSCHCIRHAWHNPGRLRDRNAVSAFPDEFWNEHPASAADTVREKQVHNARGHDPCELLSESAEENRPLASLDIYSDVYLDDFQSVQVD